MHRRKFIALVGGATAWPIAARAQQTKKMPTIGMLALGPPTSLELQSFIGGLRELGWIDGENVLIEWREAHQQVGRLPQLAAELAQMQVNVIFAGSSTQVEAATQATKTIPIVFAAHADPVGIGHVASLARPGGNITGLSQLNTELAAKDLEVLKEAIPSAKRIGVLWDPTSPSHVPGLKAIEEAAEKLGIHVDTVPASSADEFDGALSTMMRVHIEALQVASSPLVYRERVRLAGVVLKYRLPGVFPNRENAVAGGLLSYGANLPISIGAQRATSTGYSRAPSQPTFRSSRRPNTNSSSISRRQRRSASRSRLRC